MRVSLVVGILLLTLIQIAYLLWREEIRYSQPTPIPEVYENVASGTCVSIPFQWEQDTEKARFIHFFNPECPCSRFNLNHFLTLFDQYHEEVQFAVMLPPEASVPTPIN